MLFAGRESARDALNDLLTQGAQCILQAASEAEVENFVATFVDRRTEGGTAAVVRNGRQPARELQTGIGPITVTVPKVRSRDGDPVAFHSALVPPYVRKTRTLEAVLPWLYLKGISSGEMSNALEVLVSPEAKGLSASTVSRLKKTWEAEYTEWCGHSQGNDRWVYLWFDGIHSGLRAEDAKLCALVVIGVNERGEKQFLTIEDGVRESTQSWREVLLKLQARGMNVPDLVTRDGALGFWKAADEVYPGMRQQSCWVYKTANILNALPKGAQPKTALHEIWMAATRDHAHKAFDLFVKSYDDKYPKVTTSLQRDRDELLAFYDFPAAHWLSIQTTNPIESSFATVRHRTKRSKGCLSRTTKLHMIFKLGRCAEKKWRKLRGFQTLAEVVAGVKFTEGIEQNEVNQKAVSRNRSDTRLDDSSRDRCSTEATRCARNTVQAAARIYKSEMLIGSTRCTFIEQDDLVSN